MTQKSIGTYEDAKLILKLYELRREEKMRAAREWYARKFFPQTFEEVKAALAPGNPENAYARMIFGYWDMAASFVVAGILNAELFFESGGEMTFVWSKVQPFIRQLREELSQPLLLANVEKAIESSPLAKERLKAQQARMPKFREMLAAGGKA